MILVLAGVAILLLVALAIAWTRRRTSSPAPEQPFFDTEEREDEPTEESSTAADPASSPNGDRRVTVDAGALVGATTASRGSGLQTAGSLAARSTTVPERPEKPEPPRTVRFWRLFDDDADVGSGPVCFAVDGVTLDGVIDLVTMDFEHRGFVVRPQSTERIRAHRGTVVLQATFRSVHTDLVRRHGVYEGTAQPFVLVEIEVPPADPPDAAPPTIGIS